MNDKSSDAAKRAASSGTARSRAVSQPEATDPANVADNIKEREGVTTDRGAEHEAFVAGRTSPPLDDESVVIGAGGSVSDFESASNPAEMVTLTKNVYEEFYFPDTRTPSYRLLYHAGQTVSKSVIDELNARLEAAGNDSGEVDEANPAGIDSTTLASGTHPGIGPSLDQ